MNPGSTASGKSDNNLVVARYTNGQVIKGYTQDFFPDHPVFHVLPKGSMASVPVRLADLKAVFFVRDLIGNRLRNKNRKFPPVDNGPQQGRRIAVHFKDGELLVGYALTYSPEKPGFFVFPHDPMGNNLRVFVMRAATQTVKLGPAADQLAVTAPKPKVKPPKAA
ncbi:MAG: DUF6982 domain-containing protein [Candidatus Eiseniibacteriota bacterium]